MEILQTRILASASKNYNKAEVEMVVANASDEDLEYVENLCVQEAVNTLNKVCEVNYVEPSAPTQVQTQRTPYTGPKAPRAGGYRSNGPSEKQVKLLKRAGYSDMQISQMTAKQASEVINQYQIATGFKPGNQPQAPVYPQAPPQYTPNYPQYPEVDPGMYD